MKIEKWYTKSEYVDLQTGEIISKNEYERNYYKIKNTKKTKIEEYVDKGERKQRGVIQYTTQCRRKNQLRLLE